MKSPNTKITLLQFPQGKRSNQKLQERIFSPTQEKLKNKKFPTLQKNKTSFHRTVRTSNSCASIVNRFGQTVCGLQTVVLRTNSKAAHNIRLKEILKKGALTVIRTVVHLSNSGGNTNSHASNPPFLKLL